MEKVECLIIGSGPAGYTAAIYAARADMKPVMYEGLQPGGQLTITTEVENYPGFPHGVQGPEMMVMFKEQAVRLGTDVRFGMVTSVEFKQGGPQKVVVDGTHEIEAQAVIISTGASAKWLGIPSEQRLNGSGVSACAVCDGFFYAVRMWRLWVLEIQPAKRHRTYQRFVVKFICLFAKRSLGLLRRCSIAC